MATDIRRRAEIRQAAAGYQKEGPKVPKVIATPAEVLELVDGCDSTKLMLAQLGAAAVALTKLAGGAEVEVPEVQYACDEGVFSSWQVAHALREYRRLVERAAIRSGNVVG